MKSRNPVLPFDRYFPDGEPHLIGGELFVYPSCDLVPGSYCSDKLFVVHSRDLSGWTVDGPVFSCADLSWDMAVSYPPGLAEAKSYKELPSYLKDMLPKHINWFLPFRIYKSIVKKSISKTAGDVSKRMLYAPDSLTVDGKSYLFFCTSDGREGVAFADDPVGPFRDPVMITGDKTGTPIEGIEDALKHFQMI